MSKTLLTLLACWSLMALCVQMRPIDDVDLFWQLRLGEITLETHSLVWQDLFTFTHAGEAVPPIAWLGQVVFAACQRTGSWEGLRCLHGCLFSGAFVLALGRTRGMSLFSVVCAVALGFVTSLSHCSVRPQVFGIFCFALAIHIVDRDLAWRTKWYLLTILFVVWQNLHPSVALGAVALGARALADWLAWLRDTSKCKPIAISLASAWAGVLQFATPMGLGILESTRINTQVSRDWLRIPEWLPPWDPSVRDAVSVFWVALVFSIFLAVKLRSNIEWRDGCIFLIMTILSLVAARFTLFWAVAMVPVWAHWIEQAKPPDFFSQKADIMLSRWYAFPALLAALSVTVAIPALLPRHTFAAEIPFAAIEELKARLPEPGPYRIYNYREWAGPLIYRGYPRWRVAIDGRLYLFGQDEWNDYNNAALGNVPLEVIVEKFQPDAFFLRPSFDELLVERLTASSEWEKIHADETAVVFVQRK